ncbi:MAG: rod shape-determining protein MreD [Salinibacter sp.]
MPRSIRRLFAAAAVFGLQWLILGRLRIYGAFPDALLLFLAWYALREGRRRGTLMGFGLGLAMDVVYGTWGIHTFAKTLLGFLVGRFAVEKHTPLIIRPQQAFLGGLVLALLHNGLLVALLALQTQATTGFLLSGLWLGSALYTAGVAGIAALFAQ